MGIVTRDDVTAIASGRWHEQCRSPRMKQLMQSLIQHLHQFAREVELTPDEWLAAVDFLTRTGQISDAKRHEFILLSDVLGLSMLMTLLNDNRPAGATPSTLLGPFYIEGSPEKPHGEDIGAGIDGEPLYVSGFIRAVNGRPIPAVRIDMWQSDPCGLYESQIEDSDVRLRAVFHSDSNGRYVFRTVVPADYPIPTDGPVGELLAATTISIYRPAHIHFRLSAPGYQDLVTHIFRAGSKYLQSDVVFGVRRELVAAFERHETGTTPLGERSAEPFYTLEYDFVLTA